MNDNTEHQTDQDRNSWVHRLTLVAVMIYVAALSRLLPHAPNFTAIGAMSLFGGACLRDRRFAISIPLSAMLLSDLYLGFHALVPIVYGSIALNVVIGRFLEGRRSPGLIFAATLLCSAQFFVLTNLGCWWLYYSRTVAGITECFVAAIPYFQNTLAGDVAYSATLFGGLTVLERLHPSVRERPAASVH